jgi:pyroglutamyl-peptidase
MPRVLITAFEPYDCWQENASWLTLVELTKDLPDSPHVTTRRYPVDFAAVRKMLQADLQADYDYALHLGQSPGSSRVRLEAIGVNVGGTRDQLPDQFQALVPDGPIAYRSSLPLANWAERLRAAGIPAQVSYHAGTYLCNATLYLTHHFAQQCGLKTRAAFLHLPLDTSQTISEKQDLAALSKTTSAAAIRLILAELRS